MVRIGSIAGHIVISTHPFRKIHRKILSKKKKNSIVESPTGCLPRRQLNRGRLEFIPLNIH